jgi:DNA polymerase I-like protein with 3'-5' exonuclease and polymerase domains
MNYDQIKKTSGTPDDRYNKAKYAVFAMIYGGEGYTLMTRLGVPIEVANEAYQKFTRKYPGVGQARRRVIDAFCSIRQEGGPGSKIVWKDPAEYVENFFGFRRWFILENRITKTLFELAENPPEEWKNLKVKVRRRDREQTIAGAVQSALFGCAFQIQAANMRAAANHEIQSSGAQITKICQRKLWDVQPHGVNKWYVQPMNVHDEILAPMTKEVVDKCHKIIYDSVESFRPRVPLIEFEFKPMQSWAEK